MVNPAKLQAILNNNGIKVLSISKFSSGQVNGVYNINNKYVLKIAGEYPDRKNILDYQIRIYPRLEKVNAKVPRLLAAGVLDGKRYILMEKLKGDNLVYNYLQFTKKEKEHIWREIIDELKKWHSIKFYQYYIPKFEDEYLEDIQILFNKIIDFTRIDFRKLDRQNQENITLLQKYFNDHISRIKDFGPPVLIHGDIHLENIIYHNGKLSGFIDFDWAAQAPKEYDLWQIFDFAYFPHHFVEQKLEKDYIGYDMKFEISILKKYYPELFEDPQLIIKYKLFSIEYIIDSIQGYLQEKWSKNVLREINRKIKEVFKHNWVEKLLET